MPKRAGSIRTFRNGRRTDAADDGRHRSTPGALAADEVVVGRRPRRHQGHCRSGLAGRRDEAERSLRRIACRCRDSRRLQGLDGAPDRLARSPRGRHDDRASPRLSTLKIQDDPEAIFQEGWLLCDVGEHAARARPARSAPSRAATSWRRRSRARRQFDAIRDQTPHSSPFSRTRKPAGTGRWPRSARPAATACSAG